MPPQSSPAVRRARRRGATLIEVIVAMTIFGVGMLGVIQAQVLVARQNGLSRRQSRAAALMRDFIEAVQRWEYADPRLASPPCAVGAPPKLSEQDVGTARLPNLIFDFTATPASSPQASLEGVTSGALTLSGTRPYDGLAPQLLGTTNGDRYQLLWSVRQVQTNASLPGCQAKVISVAVRYPISASGDAYRSVVNVFIKHENSMMNAGGIGEIF